MTYKVQDVTFNTSVSLYSITNEIFEISGVPKKYTSLKLNYLVAEEDS